MREQKRIKPYCDTLASIWSMVPDWRLSQLMINAIEAFKDKNHYDPFYMEDQDFLMYLFEYISEVIKDA